MCRAEARRYAVNLFIRTSKKARQRPDRAIPGSTGTNSLAGTKSVDVGLSLTLYFPVGCRRRWGTNDLAERKQDYRENREGRAVRGWANVPGSPLYKVSYVRYQ